MTQELENRFGNLVLSLIQTRALVAQTLQDDEMLGQFGNRGIQKKDLLILIESVQRVSGVWYDEPQPT